MKATIFKVIGNSNINLSYDQLKLFYFQKQDVDSKQGNKIIAKSLKEHSLRLVNGILSHIVRALIVYP